MTVAVATLGATPTRMRARAHVRTEIAVDAAGRKRTRLVRLRSQAPLKLRPTIAQEAEPWPHLAEQGVRVCLAAAAAGPVGGDELELTIEVGAGSALTLTEASASLVLPGRDGARSSFRVRVDVGEGARFTWLPKPVIAARGCDHVNDIDIALTSSARVWVREELLLGRRGERSGRVSQVVRVRRDGRPVHVQELRLGGAHSETPAVVSEHRAIGSLLVVDPALPELEPLPLPGYGALLPLAAGSAVLAQGLAADSIALRQQLSAALDVLGAPWDARPPRSMIREEPK